MSSRRRLAYWLCQFIGWMSHAALNITFYAPSPRAQARVAFAFVIAAGIAIGCSHGLRAFIHRRGWLDLSPFAVLPRAGVASAVVGTVIAALGFLVFHLLRLAGAAPTSGSARLFLAIAAVWSITVFLWTAIYFGVHYFEYYRGAEMRNLQLTVAAKEAQLRGLIAQINPHFIFNCLNSVRALIIEDPARARDMVTELSELLRYALRSGQTATVPLGDELTVVAGYLKLEAIRFDERLRYQVEVDPGVASAPVPPLLLQSLVENAVKHGIARRPEGGVVRVEARALGGGLRLVVHNSGRLDATSGSTRIGIDNVAARLRLLYRDASFTLREAAAGVVVAEVLLPHLDGVPVAAGGGAA